MNNIGGGPGMGNKVILTEKFLTKKSDRPFKKKSASKPFRKKS